ncbi:MAG: response regulator [Deltaproteobacteria bacterium]|nr:response regulator [Deltaproteobacteria bacterium]
MTGQTDRYGGKIALVVDDDRVVRLILRRMLEGMGFEVLDAPDGKIALVTASQRPLHLVITDQYMPRMNGLEFFRMARAAGMTAPVIFLTALGTPDEAHQALTSGASDFIEKPLRMNRLVDAVHAAMNSSDTDSLSVEIDVEEFKAGEAE